LYFVAPSYIGGVDVLTLLHAGARGVVDKRALGCTGVFKSILSSQPRQSEADEQNVIIGTPYDRLAYLKRWAIDEYRIPESHWCLLVALAQIPSPRLGAAGGRLSAYAAADMLSSWHLHTGYHKNSITRRQVPLVFKLLRDVLIEAMDIDDDEVDAEVMRTFVNTYLPGIRLTDNIFELGYLPTYARLIGLPNVFIPLRLESRHDLASMLYQVLSNVRIYTLAPIDGFRRGRISFSAR
jgi:hypothetical protein